MLRQPYHALLQLFSPSLALNVGGHLPTLVPARFCAREQERYETEVAEAISTWCDENPSGLYVDIGCSYGYFACGVLFASEQTRVLAIDADLPSLSITRHVCQHAPNAQSRLDLICALIGPTPSTWDRSALLEATAQRLAHRSTLEPENTNYVNFDSAIPESELPRICLDQLLEGMDASVCLLKCDVEGAELLVLEGAVHTLARRSLTLLISVHPQFLHRFGGTVDGVRTLLESKGYKISIIGIDHEEHWLCTKPDIPERAGRE